MRVRYPFAGGFVALVLMAGYLGLAEVRISAINDKMLHFLVFFLLAVTLYWVVELPRRMLMKIVLGAMAVLSVASEVLQGMLNNGREFDPADIAANLMGSLAAIALCQWYHKRMLERKRRQKLTSYGIVPSGEDDLDLELGAGPGPSVDERGVYAEEDEEAADAWDDLDDEQGHDDVTEEPAKVHGEG